MKIERFDFLLIMFIGIPFYRLRNYAGILLIFTHEFLWNTKMSDFLTTLDFEGNNFYKTQPYSCPVVAAIRRLHRK